jgi:hypothetical protein
MNFSTTHEDLLAMTSEYLMCEEEDAAPLACEDAAESVGFQGMYDCEPCDCSDDGEALASAGFGTDEDYGYYGEQEYE